MATTGAGGGRGGASPTGPTDQSLTGPIASDSAAELAAPPPPPPPPLLSLLAGDLVTAGAVWLAINTVDATALRRLHPLITAAVAQVPWCDVTTAVRNIARWRAAFPAARGARCVATQELRPPRGSDDASGATLVGLKVAHLVNADQGSRSSHRVAASIGWLPPSLAELALTGCAGVVSACFSHLPALTTLDCCGADVRNDAIASLPPSLLAFSVRRGALSPAVTFAHLPALRALDCSGTLATNATVVSLPPCLAALDIAGCPNLSAGLTFAHLPALCALSARRTSVDDGALASLHASLAELDVSECACLSATASFAHLHALRRLDCSGTAVGDASLASMPRSLVELALNGCVAVTAAAAFDHLPALRWLGNMDVAASAETLSACRARGCFCPHVVTLRGHTGSVRSLARLPDGRLASGDDGGSVRLWDLARGGGAVAVLKGHGGMVHALVALPGSLRVAAGVRSSDGIAGYVFLWDAGVTPPTRGAMVDCGRGVVALAVLPDGRLAAGCIDAKVQLVDVAAAAVTATLVGHTSIVAALAVLPDGRLASGSWDKTVRLWELASGTCIATLAGHTDYVRALAVLADGRLASGSADGSVRLWELDSATCTAVLAGRTHYVCSLAALPDGRLASGSVDAIRLWDTRRAHPGSTEAAAILEGHADAIFALAALPDGRLAAAAGDKMVRVWELP